MPFSGDTFTKLYGWLNDPQRNEKIFNSRLDDEFGGVATGLTTLAGRTSVLEAIPVASTPACFSANKNSVDQTGIADSTFTLLTFGTELYDVGNYFSANAWTPPAGKVLLIAYVVLTGTVTTGNIGAVDVYKNGSAYGRSHAGVIGGAFAQPFVVFEDVASGSDSYSAYAYLDVDSGTATAVGNPFETFFMGHWLSA